ncbi:MAG: ABC transporter ATP-binding protein [Desulfobacterales bacterium]
MDEEKKGVCLQSLTKKFGKVVAVDEISLHVDEGEFLTLLGPSGSGKTTTLMMIAGFELPTAGKIFIRGKDVMMVPPHERNIGMVFQNYALFPHMTVSNNVAFPLKMRKLSKKEITQRVGRVLEIVKLPGFENRLPRQLSGGQQQRVALARALIYDPPLLLMDEPLGALDKKLREHMQIEIRNLQRELIITSLYVTHDQQEALTMSDRVAVFDQGKIQQVGTPDELYEKPSNPFVADFIGESNFIAGHIVGLEDDSAIMTSEDREVEIPCPRTSGLVMEQKVQLVIRPEKIRFVEPSFNPLVRVDGVVEELIYSGEVRRYTIRISHEQTIDLKQQIMHGVKAFRKGDRVSVGWSLEDSKIL